MSHGHHGQRWKSQVSASKKWLALAELTCNWQLKLVISIAVHGAHGTFHHTAQHQQADDFGRWGAHAESVICSKIGMMKA